MQTLRYEEYSLNRDQLKFIKKNYTKICIDKMKSTPEIKILEKRIWIWTVNFVSSNVDVLEKFYFNNV